MLWNQKTGELYVQNKLVGTYTEVQRDSIIRTVAQQLTERAKQHRREKKASTRTSSKYNY